MCADIICRVAVGGGNFKDAMKERRWCGAVRTLPLLPFEYIILNYLVKHASAETVIATALRRSTLCSLDALSHI